MNIDTSKLRRIEFRFLLPVLLLATWGLILIYSADHAQHTFIHFNKQLIFVISGTVIMFTAAFTSPRVFYAFAYAFFGFTVLMLLFVLGSGIIGFGAKRWLAVGGIRIQPSEVAKIGYILALARILADWRLSRGWKLMGVIIALGVPTTMLVLIQPDLGTSTVFPVVTVALLAWYGIPLRYFLFFLLPLLSVLIALLPWVVVPIILLGLGWLKRLGQSWLVITAVTAICAISSFSGPIAWNNLEPYQKKRLTTFLDPAADPLGSGYQVIQSKVAVGSGGFSGMGFLNGTQTQLRFLPQQHTDFIFSLAGEEFGFVGTSFILLLYITVVWFGFRTASLVRNQFMSLAVIGMVTMLCYHAVINIGMVLGDLPVTGLPLPFLSYGGSFLLTCMLASGIVLSAFVHWREY